MKVMVPRLAGVRNIEYYEREISLTPDTILVRHICTGPSQGTALHLYRGEHLEVDYVRRTRPWPYVWVQGFAYGVGRVEEVGTQVKGIREGDAVLSQKLMSELSVMAPADATVIPEGLDPEAAALSFQARVALGGIRAAHIALGEYVLVTGQGPIGICVSQLSRIAGARRVFATDLSDKKLEVSRQVGVDAIINAGSEDVGERVMELTGGKGVEVAAEVSGTPQALIDCTKAAAVRARVTVIGWTMAPLTVSFAEDFTPKGLDMTVQRGEGKPDDREFLLEMIAEGRLRTKELVTHRFPLKDLVKGWEFIDSEPGEYVQVLFIS